MLADQIDLFSERGVSPLEDNPRTATFGPLTALRVPVVGLSGAAGSGKSTASAWLVSQGYKLVKFAGPLKDMCRAIGMTEDMIEGNLKEVPNRELLQGKSPRFAMQTLGAEWGRNLMGSNFWTDLWSHRAEQALASGHGVVVDDCRYENEAERIWELGGIVIRLEGRGGIGGKHSSEQLHFDPDDIIANTGTITDLHAALAKRVLA